MAGRGAGRGGRQYCAAGQGQAHQDGKTALALAAAEHPDAILLDVNMPDLSGIEVLNRLYANQVTRGIPVVIITGADFNLATEKLARENRNCRGFLSKLASSELIHRTIENAMK